MPIKKSAKKAMRQDVKRAARNLQVKKKIEMLQRKVKRTMGAAKLEEAGKLYRELQQAVDKAAKKNIFHRNKSARIKARLSKKIKALKK